MKTLIIDGTNHIAGRLATRIAKHLLEGTTIKVVNAESIVQTGPIHRAKGKYKEYLNKRCLVQPRNGPFHYKEPSKFFIRMVRRMVPHKTKRGTNALKNLEVFEAVPNSLIGVERMQCPKALLKFKANPIRKFFTLGELLNCFGWKHAVVTKNIKEKIAELEKELERELEIKDKNIMKIKSSKQFMIEVNEALERYM